MCTHSDIGPIDFCNKIKATAWSQSKQTSVCLDETREKIRKRSKKILNNQKRSIKWQLTESVEKLKSRIYLVDISHLDFGVYGTIRFKRMPLASYLVDSLDTSQVNQISDSGFLDLRGIQYLGNRIF